MTRYFLKQRIKNYFFFFVSHNFSRSFYAVVFLLLFVSCQGTQQKTKQSKSVETKNSAQSLLSENQNPQINFTSVYIELFDNQNTEAGLNARLRQKLMYQYSSDSRLAVQRTREQADLVLSGSIDSFALLPISYDPLHNTTRYQLQIVVTFYLTPHSQENYSESVKNLILGKRQAQYSSFYSSQMSGLNALENAKEKLLEGISRRIVHVSLDNWYRVQSRFVDKKN